MTPAVIVILVFAAFNLVGGLIGFFKAGSTASLVAGSIAAVILFFSGYFALLGVPLAYAGAAAIGLALASRFFKTWREKKRVMPDLLMVVLGLSTAGICAYEYFTR